MVWQPAVFVVVVQVLLWSVQRVTWLLAMRMAVRNSLTEQALTTERLVRVAAVSAVGGVVILHRSSDGESLLACPARCVGGSITIGEMLDG
ncbi:hypothetical protein AB0M50_43660 [Nonomuraea fuscirosea]|uniref:hypothetical protein n=1 Tax=Nonomuraea fuscirosea TaxID=1291556 RepID=UPI0034301308